jgi:hypothetical protein
MSWREPAATASNFRVSFPGLAADFEIRRLTVSGHFHGSLRARQVDIPGRNFFFGSPLSARTEEQGRSKQMSDTYIIEVSSQPAGIVVRNPDGYRFFAATHRFNQLEGQLFRNAREAERAAVRLASGEFKLVA